MCGLELGQGVTRDRADLVDLSRARYQNLQGIFQHNNSGNCGLARLLVEIVGLVAKIRDSSQFQSADFELLYGPIKCRCARLRLIVDKGGCAPFFRSIQTLRCRAMDERRGIVHTHLESGRDHGRRDQSAESLVLTRFECRGL